MNLDQARFFMVEQQIRPWDILDPKILDLYMDIPRHLFVDENQQELAYTDIELPIGHGEVMMAPKIEAKLLQALDIDEEESVLEIGTGSGFLTALLANLAAEVTTVELHEDLMNAAKTRLSSFNNIDFQSGDGAQNWDDGKQYDAIILTGSVAEVPQAYKEKLNLGGRLAVISGQAPAMSAQLFTRISNQEWEQEVLFETELAPLNNAAPSATFKF